jgi:hypothetical protein
MSGVAYQRRTHLGARSSLGTTPSGGVQFHAGRTPGGTVHPSGDGTLPGPVNGAADRLAATCSSPRRRRQDHGTFTNVPRPTSER